MSKFLKVLGQIWAAPVTFFGLVYALSFWALRWYSFQEASNNSLVWVLNAAKAPVWLQNLWKGWGGHTIGSVIVLAPNQTPDILVHEEEHTLQCMKMGVFQPIMYALMMFTIKWACPKLDFYEDCIFEVSARVTAGEPK